MARQSTKAKAAAQGKQGLSKPAANMLVPRKQAVVVIHGMGEQRPMDTLRSFVESLFVKDDSISGAENQVWSVPDQKGLSYELRRLSTPVSKENVRTDFFEFYYADVMSGNTMSQLSAWFWDLLFRRPKDVPARMAWPWFVLWILTLGVLSALLITLDVRAYVPHAALWQSPVEVPVFVWMLIAAGMGALLAVGGVFGKGFSLRDLMALGLAVGAGAIAVWLLSHDPTAAERFYAAAVAVAVTLLSSFALRYFGDVARYVRAAPDTVQARHEIRERGLKFMEGLHDGSYERIIVVAHSLGTIVAYDLLNLLWQKIGPTSNNPPSPNVVEALAKIDAHLPGQQSGSQFDVDKYRDAQWQVFKQLRASRPQTPKAWLISDFITLGSPLTHADFLMERNAADFGEAKRELELPVSPPLANIVPENVITDGVRVRAAEAPSILYEVPATGITATHHAAMFAATRWTNIYDPRSWIVFGDLVSGPVSTRKDVPGFGLGIRDVEVRMTGSGPFKRVFTHSLYGLWQSRFNRGASRRDFAHIMALRKAADLNAIGTEAARFS